MRKEARSRPVHLPSSPIQDSRPRGPEMRSRARPALASGRDRGAARPRRGCDSRGRSPARVRLPRVVNTFPLPRWSEATGVVRVRMASELSGRPSGPIILVVDDDCDQRSAFGEMLTLAGYEVVIACDGQEALEL